MLRLGEVALRRTALAALVLGLVTGASGAACTTNHDALARQPPAGGAGAGGVGGGGGGAFTAGGSGQSGSQAQGGRTNPDDEPPGDDVLTIVNGVVDAPSLRLCFARMDDDGDEELVGAPLPELGYARSVVLTELPKLSFVRDVLVPWVLVGELEELDGLDCKEAVERARAAEAAVTPAPEEGGAGGAGGADPAGAGGAGPELEKPSLRARALPALPAGTVAIGRSILMVLAGCVGGAAYDRGPLVSVCGAGYAPDAPTLQPVVVKLSREFSFGKVGLQGLHASLAMGGADLRVTGNDGTTALVFGSSVSFGKLAPRPADTRFSPVDVGAEDAQFGVQAVGFEQEVLAQKAWPALIEDAGLPGILPGRTYTAVLVGPRPRLLRGGWWNAPTLALVDNDPTRQ